MHTSPGRPVGSTNHWSKFVVLTILRGSYGPGPFWRNKIAGIARTRFRTDPHTIDRNLRLFRQKGMVKRTKGGQKVFYELKDQARALRIIKQYVDESIKKQGDPSERSG